MIRFDGTFSDWCCVILVCATIIFVQIIRFKMLIRQRPKLYKYERQIIRDALDFYEEGVIMIDQNNQVLPEILADTLSEIDSIKTKIKN